MVLGLLAVHMTLLDLKQFMHDKLKLPFSSVRGFWESFIHLYQFMGAKLQTEMTTSERHDFEELQGLPRADLGQWVTLDSVMDGQHQLSISHAGGELSALTDVDEEWNKLCT